MPAVPEQAPYRAPQPQYPPQQSPSFHQAPPQAYASQHPAYQQSQQWQPPSTQAAQQHIVALLPDIPPDEAVLLQGLVATMTAEQANRFAMMYRGQRIAPWVFTLLAIICPIHRFLLGRIGTGILYWVTLGGLGWWWIIDIFLSRSMAMHRNMMKAQHIALLVRAA